MTSYCFTCHKSHAMRNLRHSTEYVVPPGIPITGQCAVCKEPKTFVVSPDQFKVLIASGTATHPAVVRSAPNAPRRSSGDTAANTGEHIEKAAHDAT